jgi:hypothetical protein
MMSTELAQKNKETIWTFWQKLNHAKSDNVADIVHCSESTMGSFWDVPRQGNRSE